MPERILLTKLSGSYPEEFIIAELSEDGSRIERISRVSDSGMVTAILHKTGMSFDDTRKAIAAAQAQPADVFKGE